MILDQIQSSSFLDLTDTPSTYSGSAGKVVTVNSGSNGLEFTTATTGSGGTGYDSFRHIASGSNHASRYVAGEVTFFQKSNVSIVANYLYAVPLVVPNGGTIDELQVYIVTGAPPGNRCRIGIYKAKSKTDLYPGDLIQDCGIFSTALSIIGGVSGLSISIGSSELYWIVINSDVNWISLGSYGYTTSNLLGCASPYINAQYCANEIYKAQAFAPFSASFPSGGTWDQGGFPQPMIWYHLSS